MSPVRFGTKIFLLSSVIEHIDFVIQHYQFRRNRLRKLKKKNKKKIKKNNKTKQKKNSPLLTDQKLGPIDKRRMLRLYLSTGRFVCMWGVAVRVTKLFS